MVEDARTCSLSLRSLHLLLACSSVALSRVAEEAERVEESSEWVVLHIYRLHLRVLYVFNMYYSRQRLLGRCAARQRSFAHLHYLAKRIPAGFR